MGSNDLSSVLEGLKNSQSRLRSNKGNTTDEARLAMEVAEGESKLKLRNEVKMYVFIILAIEVLFLFGIILLQGFNYKGFKLNEFVFGALNTGALIHTFAMAKIVVTNLFPEENRSKARR